MPQHWFYIPVSDFADTEIVNMRMRYENSRKYGDEHIILGTIAFGKGGKNPLADYMQRGSDGKKLTKPLKNVKNKDILMIGMHGSNTQSVVGIKGVKAKPELDTRPGREGQYREVSTAIALTFTPNELAALLKMDGLNTSHKLIKLNSCFACGALQGDVHTPTDPFAKLLAEALRALKYKNVVVGGYTGTVQLKAFSPSAAKTVGLTDQTVVRPAKGTRTYYDSKGRLAPRPPKVIVPGKGQQPAVDDIV
jgi:hypothetical protein